MRIFSFEKLQVRQKARRLSINNYKCSKYFDVEEKIGITSQMQRASISISSNIAEVTDRYSYKDKSRFTEIYYGSVLELLNQLSLSKNFRRRISKYTEDISEIAAMPDGLCKNQVNKKYTQSTLNS
ncbi:four helix bundle protein [Aequorivita sp. SDUM287046]|uniref:Four helix bundle protein n=1 Tax=Aequorivita aurantiaca TaxID=3053356 RepID=A0ABT8DF65_9FLAO|nr:four helix bundle protein [Aequorivita aurantiaca]MDN3723279.1 four helix bundle protein [Aequorivita aurantiaca]